MTEPILIDGSFGEGGGQILRTSLSLSMVTGKPFRILNIRAAREKPGLLRQHLTAVLAATKVSDANVQGAALGSREISFFPGRVSPGDYTFSVGSAGSCTLIFQTLLPALLTADGPTRLTLEGGTHNPFAPPFDFLATTFLPIINRMGPTVSAALEQPGFYPAGGGRFSSQVTPCPTLEPFELLERGPITGKKARALVANLPLHIGKRELEVVARSLEWPREVMSLEEVSGSRGPGNVLMIEISSHKVTEVFTGFGTRGVPAEKVASQTVKAARAYLEADVPVGEYLADQLLIPMALAGGGALRTLAPSLHCRTNIDVLRYFLDVDISLEPLAGGTCEVKISREAR